MKKEDKHELGGQTKPGAQLLKKAKVLKRPCTKRPIEKLNAQGKAAFRIAKEKTMKLQ